MDLPAEFYIETVKSVFQDHLLPLGKLRVHGTQSSLAQSGEPRFLPSKASVTISAASVKHSRRKTSAPGCGST